MASSYIDIISKELDGLKESFATIYIGGGTPTTLEKNYIEKLLKNLKKLSGKASEFTFEANPESLTEEKIKILLDNGVNRLSIGMQSLKDRKLQKLGRVHDSNKARQAVRLASALGFKNISVDLIYGVWDEDMKDWKDELEEITAMPITHISCYALTYEKDTPLFNALKDGWTDWKDG